MNYWLFTQAQAHEWGWKPKDGDEYYSTEVGEWRPHPLWGDSGFEVEALNRRPEHSVVTDLLVKVQSLTLKLERVEGELKVFNPLG